MKILYYDCFSGISGDMNLGALLDLGVDREYFLNQLSLLGLEYAYEIKIETAQRMGITGTKVEIHTHTHTKGRMLPDIERIIMESTLEAGVKNRSLKMFHILAEAEAKVHGIPKEQIHFHEVGAVDAILDIVGAAVCLEYLQVDKIISSKIELGGGFVHCAHGILPVPAPAVLELLRGVPVKTGRVEFETTTPTGAAILAANVDEYTEQLDLKIEKIGYGIGMRELDIPNVLRIYLGKIPSTDHHVSKEGEFDSPKWQREVQWMLEANIDDMSPELFGYAEERLFTAGALDVYKTPMIMKKGRPAVKLSVLAPKEKLDILQEIIFRETSAIGLRSFAVEKSMLIRKLAKVQTEYGSVTVKFCYLDSQLLKYKAEYEDCRILAMEKGIPIREIYQAVDLEVKNSLHDLS